MHCRCGLRMLHGKLWWPFLNSYTPHPYLVPILFSPVHPYILFNFFKKINMFVFFHSFFLTVFLSSFNQSSAITIEVLHSKLSPVAREFSGSIPWLLVTVSTVTISISTATYVGISISTATYDSNTISTATYVGMVVWNVHVAICCGMCSPCLFTLSASASIHPPIPTFGRFLLEIF